MKNFKFFFFKLRKILLKHFQCINIQFVMGGGTNYFK